MKDLLITHIDLDGISPIILYTLTKRKFDYKSIDINDLNQVFDELFQTDLSVYENIYITDLSLTDEIYQELNKRNLTIKVFDHHETHEFANKYEYVTVTTSLNNRPTCGTELFYNYLKEIYHELDTPIIKDYVEQVRQLDTYTFESSLPREIDQIKQTIGTTDFIKATIRRLKSKKEKYELNSFEKKLVRIKAEELERFFQKKEKKMLKYIINNHKCGIVFSETNKSDLGNYLANKYPELDLIILIDASSRISYRTVKDNVSVSEFATLFGGGGHQKASGSSFTDENRNEIITNYFKTAKRIED